MGRVGRLRVADRRRRGASGRVRTALLDAVARTEGLGLTVVGVYDASIFASTSSWVDARGATSGGPTITLTGSPTLSNGVYTFNGTNQYGRASGGRLGEITGDCALVMIGTPPAASGAGTRRMGVLSAAGGGQCITAYFISGQTKLTAAASGATLLPQQELAGLAGARIWSVRRTGGTLGLRVGSAAETTEANTLSAQTGSRLTIAAGLADTPTEFGPLSLRTAVIVKGDYSSSAQAIWLSYATLRGATV